MALKKPQYVNLLRVLTKIDFIPRLKYLIDECKKCTGNFTNLNI